MGSSGRPTTPSKQKRTPTEDQTGSPAPSPARQQLSAPPSQGLSESSDSSSSSGSESDSDTNAGSNEINLKTATAYPLSFPQLVLSMLRWRRTLQQKPSPCQETSVTFFCQVEARDQLYWVDG